MGKIGKISVIPKDANNAFPTMDTSLRQRGFSRFPGTVSMKLPYMEAGGKFRTGLDENIKSLLPAPGDNKEEKAVKERKRKEIIDLREKLEAILGGIDLGPKSSFWTTKQKDKNAVHVSPYSLRDGDNFFDLDDAMQHITYLWLKNHPTVASSLEAYYGGEYPAETQFYINDEETTADIEYNKKKTVNDAVSKFSSFSVEKRKKVARLLGLPIAEDAKETTVYNAVDNYLKAKEVTIDHFKGSDPLRIFSLYASLNDDEITIRETIERALEKQIYRVGKSGKIFEGEQEVFGSKDNMIDFFTSDSHQEDYLELLNKLKLKKVAEL